MTEARAPLRVFITVDVESGKRGRPSNRIWGRIDGVEEEYGIGRIMDVLDAHGVKGTFFLTPYETAVHGEEDVARAARAIHERGHDLELHTHPYFMFGLLNMSDATLGDQERILALGKDMLRRWSGKSVIAHRAGAYGANLDTLEACRRTGLEVDASFCPAVDTELSRQLPATNEWFRRDGVLVLPVTYYVQARLGRIRFRRILDIEGSTLAEFKKIVRQARDNSLGCVNVMMHSFSFFRHGRPDLRTLRRFDELLGFLVREPGVAVATVSSFHERAMRGPEPRGRSREFVPHTGWWLTYRRAIEDFDKGWANVVFGLSPVVALLLAVLITLYVLR